MANLRAVPGQYTTDTTVVLTAAHRRQIAAIPESAPATRAAAIVKAGKELAGEDPNESEDYRLIAEIAEKKALLDPEQGRLRDLFRRMDNLYNPEVIAHAGGADHWPLPRDKQTSGRTHVSVNTPPVYVDIPASLQAEVPVESYVADEGDDDEREAAARAERLYFQWKDDAEFELEVHKGCLVKGLYGFTFGKVFWDAIESRPAVRVIDSPENLYVGWGDSDYRRIDWAIYCYGLSPQAVKEDYGLGVIMESADGKDYFPVVTRGNHDDPIRTIHTDAYETPGGRIRTAYEQAQVEVYDYWYKKPVPPTKSGKPRRPEIWNAIYVGNELVKNERHREYDDLPYVPLQNTYIPGSPYGKPELFDIEQLFREKDERLTQAAQMIQSVVGGQMWQLVGSEAPDEVPANAMPQPNKVATPGPGNELKAIQPFMPQFAIEDYLKRIDVEMEVVSGLNDLLLGKAPATILGSSKAITALVANYEARIRMKRDLLYQWRKRVWKMAAIMWERKDSGVAEILGGRTRLNVIAPSLSPRDELEIANMAINLAQNRLWTMERAMDRTGVEDPSSEKELIRSEQTDPSLNPAAVQAQATLMATFKQFGITPDDRAMQQTANTARQFQRPAAGSPSLNAEENQGNPPPEAQPANQEGSALAQTLVEGGEGTGRIIGQVEV